MSAAHGWLRFRATGHPLSRRLDEDPRPWQAGVLADHRRWYGPDAPAQVAGAFVLQYLLQVPAHAAASAAAVGLRVGSLLDVTFEVGEGNAPRVVELGCLEPGAGRLEPDLAGAEADYRAVALPLADGYVSTRRMSSQQRRGMVADMWEEAAADVSARAGHRDPTMRRRVSCCLIYALPGCVDCAACPRRRRP